MVGLLRKCVKCGRYTLRRDSCPYCNGEVRVPHPAKFSPDDKYAAYKSELRGVIDEENSNSRERGS
ncbi:MAG: RNA-protein complex protein Nop10 [Candidatus Bathyarchaeia archaeon]|nr:RNA-protein complex protein Nop10 [Candidatus Bathyarchaeota archaeon]